MRRWPVIIAAVPVGLLALARVGLVILSLAGYPPFWLREPLTLSEAAAFRDGGEVARLLAAGQDPNATYKVRRGAVRGRVDATPIEAARAGKGSEIVQLLLDAGARP